MIYFLLQIDKKVIYTTSDRLWWERLSMHHSKMITLGVSKGPWLLNMRKCLLARNGCFAWSNKAWCLCISVPTAFVLQWLVLPLPIPLRPSCDYAVGVLNNSSNALHFACKFIVSSFRKLPPCWVYMIPCKLSRYHVLFCRGSLVCQDINSHHIDNVT